MHDDYRTIEIAAGMDDFSRIPRNPCYKYEYFNGKGAIVPRPKQVHLTLDLTKAVVADRSDRSVGPSGPFGPFGPSGP